MNKVSSRFFDLLNSIIDDLKRSVDLCWLFDLVLHSSLDLLVLNAEEPFNPKIWAWLGLCRCAHICFYFCGLRARCAWFWPQKSTHWLINVQSKLHHKLFMIYVLDLTISAYAGVMVTSKVAPPTDQRPLDTNLSLTLMQPLTETNMHIWKMSSRIFWLKQLF